MNRRHTVAAIAALLSAFAPSVRTSATESSQAPPHAVDVEVDADRTFPQLASERPAQREWQRAQPLALRGDSDCSATRLREWVRITCNADAIESVQLLAGNKGEVDAWLGNFSADRDAARRAVVEFPLRVGDARLFEVNARRGGYGSAPIVHIEESWLPGSTWRIAARTVKPHRVDLDER